MFLYLENSTRFYKLPKVYEFLGLEFLRCWQIKQNVVNRMFIKELHKLFWKRDEVKTFGDIQLIDESETGKSSAAKYVVLDDFNFSQR